MFDTLATRIQEIFRRLSGRGRLSEADVAEACREIRLALLRADVHYQVAKNFVARVQERAVGQDVAQSLTPGQQIVKIVHSELTALLGGEAAPFGFKSGPPGVCMLVGPQGGGKTTTAGKLAGWLKRNGHKPLLAATDVRRPAAVEQLRIVGEQVGAPVFDMGDSENAIAVAKAALEYARKESLSPVVVDTAGRLHSEQALMDEMREMKATLAPDEVLLVADAMTGQDAVNMGRRFDEEVGLTGCILTKLEGDARGGAALSLRAVTGKPIKFVGVGEKLDALEPFHPDRMASRILGMGDMLTLIEKAEQAWDEKQAERAEKRLRKGEFDFNDFLQQMDRMQDMGSLEEIAEMIPGFSRGMRVQLDPDAMKSAKAVVQSMTTGERANPQIIDGSRRRRIAQGSGTSVQTVNQLLRQFQQTKALIHQFSEAEKKGRLKGGRFPIQSRRVGTSGSEGPFGLGR